MTGNKTERSNGEGNNDSYQARHFLDGGIYNKMNNEDESIIIGVP